MKACLCIVQLSLSNQQRQFFHLHQISQQQLPYLPSQHLQGLCREQMQGSKKYFDGHHHDHDGTHELPLSQRIHLARHYSVEVTLQ
jgi:hypothetical protein